jgi:hypothetical protein
MTISPENLYFERKDTRPRSRGPDASTSRKATLTQRLQLRLVGYGSGYGCIQSWPRPWMYNTLGNPHEVALILDESNSLSYCLSRWASDDWKGKEQAWAPGELPFPICRRLAKKQS